MHSTAVEVIRQAPAKPLSWIAGLFIIACFLLFFPSLLWVAGEWSAIGGVLGHGYLVAVISAVLLARQLPQLDRIPTQASWPLVPIVVLLSVAWLAAFVANVEVVHSALVIPLVFAAFTGVYGWQAARLVAFPLAYLCLSIPLLVHTQPLFQTITTFVVRQLLGLTGMPAYVEGNFVFLESGTFEIAGGCSGLAFILAGVAIAVLYGRLNYPDWRRTLVLTLIALAVTMLGNWIRVFVVICMGYFLSMEHPMVSDHLSLGWGIFALLMIPVGIFAHRFDGGVSQARTEQTTTNRSGQSLNLPAAGLFLACVAVGPTWAIVVSADAKPLDNVALEEPQKPVGWHGPLAPGSGWQPRFVGADAEHLAEFRRGTDIVVAYSAVYLSQGPERELIFHKNDVAGEWRTLRNSEIDRIALNSSPDRYRVQFMNGYRGTWIVWYRYVVDGQPVTRKIEAKIRQALAVLLGRPAAGIVAYASPCNGDCDRAARLINEFAQVARPGFGAVIEIE